SEFGSWGVAGRRRIEELDAMPRHDTQVAHLAARKTTGARIHLLGIASRDDTIVHHHHHTLAARAMRGSDSNRRKQINGAVRADARRRALSAHHHDRLLRLYGEMKEKGRFLKAVRSVRHDDSGNLRTLLKNGVDTTGKLQPLIRCDVRARDIGKLRSLDLGVS